MAIFGYIFGGKSQKIGRDTNLLIPRVLTVCPV